MQTANVTLNGTLDAKFGAGVGTGTYRFLTTDTGQVFGSFDSVVSNLDASLFSVSALYGAKYVDLKVTALPLLAGSVVPSGGSISAVPEPSTYALLTAGLALLGWRVRRRGVGDAGL